jgi:hypothetical protein
MGTIVAFASGLLLPKDDADLKTTDLWLVIYGWIPLSFLILFLIGLLTVVKYDTIQFLIMSGNTK